MKSNRYANLSQTDKAAEAGLADNDEFEEDRLEDASNHYGLPHDGRRDQNMLLKIAVLLLSTFVLSLAYLVWSGPTNAPPESSLLGACSNSSSASRQQGCVFDPMMYNWVHEACYWTKLSDGYFERGNWTFYADSQGTVPIDSNIVRQGDLLDVWVTGDFHHSHCSYILNKRLEAENASSVSLDSKSRSAAHTEHCLKWLAKPKPQVLELTTLRFSRESLGCITGPLATDCYSPEGAKICWPGQEHSIEHHAVKEDTAT